MKPEERAARLREAKSRLRKLRLLAGAAKDDPRGLDAHPVVRAFFAGRLAETAPEAARSAHEALYRHYAAAAPDLPETLEEMQPLFQAVRHGVLAGRAQEAYWMRFSAADTCVRQDDLETYYLTVYLALSIPRSSCQLHRHTSSIRRGGRRAASSTPDDQAWLLIRGQRSR